jgi:hypothetical protein
MAGRGDQASKARTGLVTKKAGEELSASLASQFRSDCYHGGQIRSQIPLKQVQHEETVQRIHDSLQEVGLSITMTTLTTASAFILGTISTVPGIRWLCIYASVTVTFDFLYQVSNSGVTVFTEYVVPDTWLTIAGASIR